MSEPILEVFGISAGYGDGDVVSGVDLKLMEGEILGVVGPNGSGKSTLLRAINGAVKAHSGGIYFSHRAIRDISASELAKIVSVVPQAAILPEGFSALEVTLMGRTPYLRLLQSEGVSDLQIARRSMLQTDTLSLADRPVSELSGGERQRVIIARALTQQAPVLMLDEPTIHLDIGHQTALMDLVYTLSREQSLSVIAVVHDLTLAAQYCDRVMMLDNGTVYSSGKPADVLTRESIREVYQAEVEVIPHPETGRPAILVSPGVHLTAPDEILSTP